jgi:hypothetical protein
LRGLEEMAMLVHDDSKYLMVCLLLFFVFLAFEYLVAFSCSVHSDDYMALRVRWKFNVTFSIS